MQPSAGLRARLRSAASTIRVELAKLAQSRSLPARVVWFHVRARMLARRTGDVFSLASATPPRKLSVLLALADGRQDVAELGTATGWTAIAFALAERDRRVVTYDPVDRPARHAYLGLVGEDVRERIEYAAAPGTSGPRRVDLLYIDSSHEREQTIAEVRAWEPLLGPGALIVFDDYAHPDYPGVREAVEEMGLDGRLEGSLFVHEVAAKLPATLS